MKFRFKIQQYQTDAVESASRACSRGSPMWTAWAMCAIWARGCSSPCGLTPQRPPMTPRTIPATKTRPCASRTRNCFPTYTPCRMKTTSAAPPSSTATWAAAPSMCEMETGTGKTYVYIKTMFELNKRYGWSKYIVVVPSIAIREGVKKSFEITEDHFMELYGKKARCFVYDSKKPQPAGRLFLGCRHQRHDHQHAEVRHLFEGGWAQQGVAHHLFPARRVRLPPPHRRHRRQPPHRHPR